MITLREKEVSFITRKLANLIKRDVEKSCNKLGFERVKGVNGWAIAYFYENRGNNIFQKDFEEKFSIRRSTASVILKNMEEKGLIMRVSVESDARLKKIVLTEKAIEIHKKILNNIKEREKRLRKGISEEELEIYFKVMQKFCDNMEDQND